MGTLVEIPPAATKPSVLDTEIERMWSDYRADSRCDHRNRLVEHYQHLVGQVVGGASGARLPQSVDRGDMETAGNVGLMGAIASFDPERGIRFEAYADRRIRGALLDELRCEDWLPRNWRQRMELRKRTVERLSAELNRQPLGNEVAAAMQLPFDEYELLFGVGLPGTPTGNTLEGEDDSLARVPDLSCDVPGERLTRSELWRLAAKRMTEQEFRIVYLKYWEELPMREIGEDIGLSESRVCKIHSRLLDRLKSGLCESELG
jgi:RNA polymerase sigma factor for flagellar operon FliA